MYRGGLPFTEASHHGKTGVSDKEEKENEIVSKKGFLVKGLRDQRFRRLDWWEFIASRSSVWGGGGFGSDSKILDINYLDYTLWTNKQLV